MRSAQFIPAFSTSTKWDATLLRILTRIWLVLSLGIYLYFSFLNIDPYHDGTFLVPAVGAAMGLVPYKDFVSAYGWFTPMLQSGIVEIFGNSLLPHRLLGTIVLVLSSIIFVKILRVGLSESISNTLVALWLTLNIGQYSKSGLPSWGLWPTQIAVLMMLVILLILLKQIVNKSIFFWTSIFILGTLPWVRAQGILFTIIATSILFRQLRLDRIQSNKSFLFLAGVITALLIPIPLLTIQKGISEFWWQTFKMPISKEWEGVPNTLSWMWDYGRAALLVCIAYLVAVRIFSLIARNSSKEYALITVGAITLCLYLFRWAPSEEIARVPLSFFKEMSEKFFFFIPSIVVSFWFVFHLCQKLVSHFFRRNLLTPNDVMIPFLCLSSIPFIYYNFFHIWAITPVVFTGLAFLERNHDVKRNYEAKQVLALFTCVATLIAFVQVGSVASKEVFPYKNAIGRGMYGNDDDKVRQFDLVADILKDIPTSEKVFYDCQSPIFSISNGSYMSDNLFYSTHLTHFDMRMEKFKRPADETIYIVTCGESQTVYFNDNLKNWKRINEFVLMKIPDNSWKRS